MKEGLIGVEELRDGSGVRAKVYEVGPNHFRAEYLDSSGAEVYLPSEHRGMTFEQAGQEIGDRLRGCR
jgi:hypothetical protein